MKLRTVERLEALSNILCDGLNYSWFRIVDIDADACKATLRVDTGDFVNDRPIWKTVNVGPDDVARGLRMVREYFNGERELYEGQWAQERKYNPDWTPSKGSTDSYLYQLILFDRTNGQDGDYDANTADMVMQYATLGQVMYG